MNHVSLKMAIIPPFWWIGATLNIHGKTLIFAIKSQWIPLFMGHIPEQLPFPTANSAQSDEREAFPTPPGFFQGSQSLVNSTAAQYIIYSIYMYIQGLLLYIYIILYLYYIILYYFVLYYIILCYVILCYTILYYIVLYYIIIILYHIILYYIYMM